MKTLHIAPMERSPLVDFNFETGMLRLSGESYPDDASRVFGPIFAALEANLAEINPQTLFFDIELVYFNSSSAKALMNIFKRLEQAAGRGQNIEVNWRFASADETMREFGEDFSEDLEYLTFNLVETGGQ
jgi:SiaC family regulatory phosphoprotein